MMTIEALNDRQKWAHSQPGFTGWDPKLAAFDGSLAMWAPGYGPGTPGYQSFEDWRNSQKKPAGPTTPQTGGPYPPPYTGPTSPVRPPTSPPQQGGGPTNPTPVGGPPKPTPTQRPEPNVAVSPFLPPAWMEQQVRDRMQQQQRQVADMRNTMNPGAPYSPYGPMIYGQPGMSPMGGMGGYGAGNGLRYLGASGQFVGNTGQVFGGPGSYQNSRMTPTQTQAPTYSNPLQPFSSFGGFGKPTGGWQGGFGAY